MYTRDIKERERDRERHRERQRDRETERVSEKEGGKGWTHVPNHFKH